MSRLSGCGEGVYADSRAFPGPAEWPNVAGRECLAYLAEQAGQELKAFLEPFWVGKQDEAKKDDGNDVKAGFKAMDFLSDSGIQPDFHLGYALVKAGFHVRDLF